MSGLVEDLRRHHDRLNCRIEEISGTRFKTDSERDAEIELAMSLCWKAADEITRLTARVEKLEEALMPFARSAEYIDRLAQKYGPPAYDADKFPVEFYYKEVRAAMAALEPKP